MGIALMVMEGDAADAADVPTAFVAVAVKVYVVPPVNPVTTHVVVAVEHVLPSGFDVTV